MDTDCGIYAYTYRYLPWTQTVVYMPTHIDINVIVVHEPTHTPTAMLFLRVKTKMVRTMPPRFLGRLWLWLPLQHPVSSCAWMATAYQRLPHNSNE